jgi:predicted DCC family thiol-disulfide oxidoreductase YuxK
VTQPASATVVCYDGICGLCNRFVLFLLRRDRRRILRFAALQGITARQVLPAHGVDPSDLDTIYVIADWQLPSERVLARSAAVLHAVAQLNPPWPALARIASIAPRPLADAVYTAVAAVRYRLFGRYDRCPLPPEGWQRSFLDQ